MYRKCENCLRQATNFIDDRYLCGSCAAQVDVEEEIMQTYTVTWQIEIDAETPHQAASAAQLIQRNQASIATVFSCTDEYGEVHDVDLLDDEHKSPWPYSRDHITQTITETEDKDNE